MRFEALKMCLTAADDNFLSVRSKLRSRFGIHVEQHLAAGAPSSVVPVKNGTSFSDRGNRFNVFHVAAFDRFKRQIDASKHRQQVRFRIVNHHPEIQPIAARPSQSARLSAGAGNLKELFLQFFFLVIEQIHHGLVRRAIQKFPQRREHQHIQVARCRRILTGQVSYEPSHIVSPDVS